MITTQSKYAKWKLDIQGIKTAYLKSALKNDGKKVKNTRNSKLLHNF